MRSTIVAASAASLTLLLAPAAAFPAPPATAAASAPSATTDDPWHDDLEADDAWDLGPELEQHLDGAPQRGDEDDEADAPAGRPAPAAPARPRPAPRPRPRPTRTTTSGRPARIVVPNIPYARLIGATARRRGVPVALFVALVWQESGFRATVRSGAGAAGLTQLMPATARSLGVRRILDPAQNLDGGARYLRAQLATFRSERLALAAYNAGPGAVRRFGGVPPYAETQRYVRNILALEARLTRMGVR